MIFGKHIPPILGEKPANLAEWLYIATGKLVSSAQARIRAEIVAHYAESVQLHLTGGLPLEKAEVAALADLGDAEAAARRFQREHLTKKEARYVGWRFKLATNPLWLIPACLILPMVVFPYLLTLPESDLYSKLFAGAAILLSVVSAALTFGTWVLAQQKNTPALMRQIILLDCMMIFNFVALALISARVEMQYNTEQSRETLYFLGYAFYMAWITSDRVPFNFLGLRRKLKSSGEEDLRPT